MNKVSTVVAMLVLSLALSPTFAAEKKRSRAEEKAAEKWAEALPEPTADYGLPPASYEKMLKEHFASVLKDPESARYAAFTEPRTGYRLNNMFTRDVTYGYFVCTYINAKNSFGGYVGNKLTVGLFRDDKLVVAGMEGQTGDFQGTLFLIQAMKQGACK